MPTVFGLLRSKRIFLFVSSFWILLWVIPWGKLLSFAGNLYLIFFVDMAKLGVALGLFILPGVLLYLLLRHENDPLFSPWGLLPIGFALSVAIIAVIGILGRIFGFSFGLIRVLFALTGLGELILLSFFKPGFAIRKEHFSALFREMFENIPLLLALVLAISVTFNDHLFFIDDTIYQAYVTNWQHSTHLGFNNIIHQANVIENERFWLALFPMGQALLSSLSGVPAILLFSNYLELFLVPFAVITAYWFACALGLSRKAAGFSVLIQILLYTWMVDEYWPVGFWFFINMAEDKVAAVFLLAPVFFVFVLKSLETPTRSNLVLLLLSGMALMLTHPVILFFACVIAAGMGCFSWLVKKAGWREMLQLVVVVFIVMLPYLVIRLYDHPSQSQMAFDAQSASTTLQIDKYTNVVNNIFYGLNPEVLKLFDISPESDLHSAFQVFRLIPVYLALIAAVIASMRLRKGALYWYILSCVLLVALATIPYTGWILGYFVSARLISRASWFSPLGLAGMLAFIVIVEHLTLDLGFRKFTDSYANKIKSRIKSYTRILKISVFVIALAVVLSLPRVAPYFEALDHNYQLARAGAYIDQNTSAPTMVIALDYRDTQLLPGVAANSSLISFREETDRNGHNHFFSLDEIHERIYASTTIRSLDPDTSYEERCRLLKKFNVRFVLAPSKNAEFFTTEVNKCAVTATNVFETRDLVLFELQ